MATFTADAVLVGGRERHHRDRDHSGYEYDDVIVLSEPVGPYAAGTSLDVVLAALELRMAALETTYYSGSTAVLGSFFIDARIGDYFSAYSVILSASSASFSMDALLIRGGSFSLDAVLAGNGSFTVDALLV